MRTLKYFIGTLLAAGLLAVAGCTGGENPNDGGNGGPTDTTSPSVTVSPASNTVQPGGTVQVTADITDSDSNSVSVSWSASAGSISPSSDTGINLSGGNASSTATLDTSGVSGGTAITVTADVTDSPGGNSGSDQATVNVQSGQQDTTAPSVSTSAASNSVSPGGTVDVTASITDPDSNTVDVSWSASAGSISPSSDTGLDVSGGSASSTATLDASGVSGGTTITVTADVTDSPGGNTGSDTADVNVQAAAQAHEVPADTFSVQVYEADGSTPVDATPASSSSSGYPTYDVQPGSCYFLVFTTGEFTGNSGSNGVIGQDGTGIGSNSFPSGWDDSDNTLQHDTALSGNHAIANVNVAIGFPNNTIIPINQSGTQSDDDTANAGLPDYALDTETDVTSETCTTRNKVEAAGSVVTVGNPVYQSGSDDGLFDVTDAEALGGSASPSANWLGIPPQTASPSNGGQFGVSSLVRASVRGGGASNPWSVNPQSTTDLTSSSNFDGNAAWFQFNSTIQGPSRINEVVPSEDLELLSIGVRIDSSAAGGTVPVRLLDYKYQGGSRSTPLTVYQNLDGTSVVPKLQDITLNVQ